ncbi:MAG: PilZ domain-containing protein [Pseudomonadota bacterium]|nr:PilZ domain-containing protein [Pseudomonadota bacterium]
MAEQAHNFESEASLDVIERRRHVRVEMPLKARFLRADGEEHPCLVVNISAGGALMRAKNPPAESENIVIYIDEIGRFEGRVVRAGKHSFAVDYRGRRSKSSRTADSLTQALNNPGRRIDRRVAPRIRQEAHATVRLESGEVIPCSILDISLTGASIEIEPRPALGTVLTLGKMSAKVVRRHEKGVGVVFSGAAKRMDDVVNQTASAATDGAAFANSFGRKGAVA